MTAAALLLAAAALASPAPKVPRVVTFSTADGWTLTADYRPPRAGSPVLILVHGLGSSRGEWGRLADRLDRSGIGTMAVDLRGHHDSLKGPKGAGDFRTFDAVGEWPKTVEDLSACARWLEAHGIPEERIAYGGASIGANLAALAAAQSPKTPFLLLLSPGPDYHGVGLSMRKGVKTLVGASRADGYAFQTLGPLSRLPGVETFEAPAGHGVQMLTEKSAPGSLIEDRVVDWIVSTTSSKK